MSVASYRTGAPGWTRPVFQPAGPVVWSDVRHPLLPDAVPNSIVLAPPHGVIITGSNMSGKSTFLRTVGVTVVLAQTINTCLASQYEAPVFAVRTCIGRADNPASGKSYYLIEVESVLALVHAARERAPQLMLFDELFRGTNAVERIAAGEAVFLALLAPGADGSPCRMSWWRPRTIRIWSICSTGSTRRITSRTRSTRQGWPSTSSFSRAPPPLATPSPCSSSGALHRSSSRMRSRGPRRWIERAQPP